MDARRRVYGVDFSAGASDAGERTWIAECRIESGLRVERVAPVAERFDGATTRAESYRAVREFVAGSADDAVFGFDFPFSLPTDVLWTDDWSEFLLTLPHRCGGADEFRATCQRRTLDCTGGERKETKRECDAEYGGLSAYNYLIYRMTYHGLIDLLRPLHLANAVCVAPFEPPVGSVPIVVETYPAATIEKRLDAERTGYKGNRGDEDARREIADALVGTPDLDVDVGERIEAFETKLVADSGGDGLDAVLAAYGAYKGFVEE